MSASAASPAAGPHIIELRVAQVEQLFNSLDPSPFRKKDLDRDAEEFIVSWAQEYPAGEDVLLRIHLGAWPERDPREAIQESVHNYFAYRADLARLELRRLLKVGRTSLAIGLLFLTACL